MEFSFDVNELLADFITLVDYKLAPFQSRVKTDRFEFSKKQNQLKTLIDKMGEASTRAQGLRSPITSAIKLQHSDHRLYIMKDPSANNGLGAAVGILKVGHKKLFLLDLQSVQYEVNPLCVLDFYVHESRQRTGCGKMLFEHMMKMEGKMVHQLAIDRPSQKFVSFLKKYYGLKNAIPQANNFVIHEHFFSDLQAVGHVPRRSQRLAQNSVPSGRPPVHPYGRSSQTLSERPLIQRRPSASGGRHSTRPNSGRELSPFSNSNAHSIEGPRDAIIRNESLQHISLPPLVPRPSSRNSAPSSRGSSAGRRSAAMEVEFGNMETTNHARSEAYNASRGLAARATLYSRHSNRAATASVANSNKGGEAMDTNSDNNGFQRNNSGGRVTYRSLHVTSAENPFVGERSVTRPEALQQQAQQQKTQARSELYQDSNIANTQASETTPAPSGVNSAGNYSINTLFNARIGVRPPFMGTSWNIFGIPTYTNPKPTSEPSMYTRNRKNRHHQF